ncbi:MAG: L-2-amino-thiazoline-4-carboxylic acid hydrolase [Clostridia bacterium]|nr:L-2-amino-thiazoline-4-carboxylic acid hydrolase [Clostridia bacterium]
MAAKDILSRSPVYKGFRKTLVQQYGAEKAAALWQDANARLAAMAAAHRTLGRDCRMMLLPAAALYAALKEQDPVKALPLLRDYGTAVGGRIARMMHAVTSVPGVPKLLWRNMPALMRTMSSPEKGYSRVIVSETEELVGVDIIACPLHDAAVAVGLPEAAQVVCAMDKAYMTGFRHIVYTRSTSVAEGAACCDYRLRYDRSKK